MQVFVSASLFRRIIVIQTPNCTLLLHVHANTKMSSTVQSHEASSQDGSPTSPFAAELQLALSIAAEAGQMISSASSSRWRSAANADNATGSELGTKKNSVDVGSVPFCLKSNALI